MIPIIAITGYSDAGKTTVVEKLVPELKRKGFRVGTIKHSHHEANFDKKGKDSWRHFASGADAVLLTSKNTMVMIRKQERHAGHNQEYLAFLERHLTDMDIVLAEGFKNAEIPKIEVFRKQINASPACLDDPNLVAMVTDADVKINVPVFGLEAYDRLADFIVQQFLSGKKDEA